MTASGAPHSVAALTGKDDFALDYMSDTAAIWQNLNALPRAFLVHRAEVMSQSAVFERMHQSDFRADQTVLLNEGQPMTDLTPGPSPTGEGSKSPICIRPTA